MTEKLVQNYDRTVKYMSWGALLVGICLHIIPYFCNRSLWIDEAMIASSIGSRTLFTLVSEPLDYGQSAPIGYLYAVKSLVELFGMSEFSLRLWSLISFFVTLLLLHHFLKNVFSLKRPLFFTGMFSLLNFYVYYSNELKPYMSDSMFVLLTIFLFTKYFGGQLNIWRLCVCCSVIMWCSFVPVFFIAAGMLMILAEQFLQRKNEKDIFWCALVGISFVCYYLFWLSGTEANAGGKDYWNLFRFPLLPTTWDDAVFIIRMVKGEILGPLCKPPLLGYMLFLFSLWTWFKHWREWGRLCVLMVVSICLLLFASSMGFYPMKDRLVQFLGILILLFASVSMDEVWTALEKGSLKKSLLLVLAAYFLCAPLSSTVRSMIYGGTLYKNGSEVALNMQCLIDRKQIDDMVYVCQGAVPVFMYEMSYPYGAFSNYAGNYGEVMGDVILGQRLRIDEFKKEYSVEGKPNYKNIEKDVDTVAQFPSVYLFTSHMDAERDNEWQILLSELRKHGRITIVSESHHTYLYHFSRDTKQE